MNFKQIDKLKYNKATGLFNINQPVFFFVGSVALLPYIVEKEEEMRMDLVSNSIYGTTEHVFFLCRLNNIINPLNIKEGTMILHVEQNSIAAFTPPDNTLIEEVKQTLVNISKKKRVDTKREKYKRGEFSEVSLPPNYNSKDTDNITIEDDGNLTIGPGEI